MKISKTPIREALQQLEREGFIMTIPGRGSFVTHITLENLRELFDAREIIECAVARRAALIGDKEMIRARRLEFESFCYPVDDKYELERRSEDVHIFIFELLGNQGLLRLYSPLFDQIIRVRIYFNVRMDIERTAQYKQEHLDILDALIEGNPDKAVEAVLTHLRNASAYLSRLNSI